MKYFIRCGLILISLLPVCLLSACSQKTVPLLSEGQKQYIRMPRAERIVRFSDPEKRLELSRLGYHPQKFLLHTDGVKRIIFREKGVSAALKSVRLGETQVDMPAYVLAEKEADGISLGNLKIACSYAWETDNGRSGTFVTEDIAPRLLKIEGVPNVRDLGGRIGLNGKRVRQGMIYRSAGLNDNAKRLVKPVTSAMLAADGGYLGKLKADHERILAECTENGKNGAEDPQRIPYPQCRKWTVFLPDHALKPQEILALAELREIPQELFDCKGKEMTGDAKGKIFLPGPSAYKPAVFCQVFESPADGVMQIGTGADWFYRVFVNSRMELDLLETGNGLSSRTADDHVIDVPVKMGKNSIVVLLLSGSDTWSLCIGRPSAPVPRQKIRKELAEISKDVLENQLKTTFDRYEKGKVRLNDETRKYLTEDLGIRTDIDLRTDRECYGMTGSPAGHRVNWLHYSSAYYGGLGGKFGRNAFTKVFRVFLDLRNYPVLFHCIAGQDRTGAVAFILNALLGVPEEQLYLDWESTGFWNPDIRFSHEAFSALVHVFDAYPGATINERVEAYVISLGYSKADIDRFRDIMLE